jgi:hypothetical protein
MSPLGRGERQEVLVYRSRVRMRAGNDDVGVRPVRRKHLPAHASVTVIQWPDVVHANARHEYAAAIYTQAAETLR